MECAGVFHDPGVSAWKVSPFSRPGFLSMWSHVRDGDHVVCLSIDRAFRSVSDFCRISDQFRDRNITFHFVMQQFDTSSAIGKMLMQIAASFAEFKSALISERVRESHAIRRAMGVTSGKGRKRILVPNPKLVNMYRDRQLNSEHKPTGTAHGYVRVSTGDQSCEAQIEAVEAMVNARVQQGYKPGSIWIDDGVSAFKVSLPDRPMGSEMLAELDPGDIVVCHRLDRIFRSIHDMSTIIKDFNARGIYVSASSDISTDTEAGRRVIPIITYMAEMESADIGWRTRLGKQIARKLKGPWLSREELPRWMESVELGDGKWTYALRTDVVSDIVEMHQLYQSGLLHRDISDLFMRRYCAAHGIPEIPMDEISSSLAEVRIRRNGTREQIDSFTRFVESHNRPKTIRRPYTIRQVFDLLELMEPEGMLTRYLEHNGGDIAVILEPDPSVL